jgi:N-acyl-L-homoserine lactone synthetase
VLAVDDGRIEGHVRLIPGGYLAVARADPARVSAAAGHAPLYGLSRFCICPSKQGIVARRALIVQILTVAFRSVMERGCYALLFDTDPAMIFLLRLLGFAIEYVGEPASIAGRVMQPVVLRLDMSVLSGVPLKIARWNERAGAVNARSADARA